MNSTDFVSILPLIVLVAWASIMLLVDVFSRRFQVTVWLAGIGLVTSLAVLNLVPHQTVASFGGMLVLDRFAIFLNNIFLISGIFGVFLAKDYLERTNVMHGEYFSLLMYSIAGMMLMAMAADLILVFLALELLSIPLYVLTAIAIPKPISEEAGIKYFLLGAFSSSFVVFGVAMIFGGTASTNLGVITSAIQAGTADTTLILIGAGLMLIGLAFKVAVVPFQMWTPDVYQGAPTSLTAFMSVGAKAAGFAGLLRVFVTAFPSLSADLTPVFWVLSALTMVLGNVVAIVQSNIKRMLAYSSIAHAGYVMMAMVAAGDPAVAPDGVASALFYLVAYGLTSLGAWAVVIALEKAEDKGLEISDYAGLASKYPLLALAMTVFMLSFTGVPPTLGFVGKFFLFRSVLEAGYIGLAIIAVVTSLVSAYYYLRIVIVMYMQEGQPVARSEFWLNLTTAITAVGTVALTFFSAPLFQWASQALLYIF